MKKKGLIISTVVMVMVLVAALSTATFAWFSSTAQAKVQNISIKTSASEGIVVGVKNAENSYVSGDMTYDAAAAADAKWDGTLKNMSQLVDFKNISTTLGDLKSATTRVGGKTVGLDATAGARIDVFSTDFTLANFGVDTVYYKLTTAAASVDKIPAVAAVDAITQLTNTDGSGLFTADGKIVDGAGFGAAKAYLQATAGTGNSNFIGFYTKYAADQMLVPTSYTPLMKPIAYKVAVTNSNYMDLPISVSPTMDIKGIMCSIKMTPTQGGMAKNMMPGMAAASRIWIVSADGTQKQELEPFAGWAETGGKMQKGGVDFEAIGSGEKTFDYNFAVAYANEDNFVVAQNALFDLNFQIWIEGEDGQCYMKTAGSGFTVDISYSFTKTFADMTIAVDGSTVTLNTIVYNVLTGISTIIAA